MRVEVVGGGLAGCEAAWQAASLGVPVVLHEMRPGRPTAVHKTADLAELVCSNSFRADKIDNAVGLIKAEMRRLGSLVTRAADATRVPAGAALAVDRAAFAALVTHSVANHPLVTVVRDEVRDVPPPGSADAAILATGPLTSDDLSARIADFVGRRHLYFYDAISPIVLAETIDRTRVFRASRWDRSVWTGPAARSNRGGASFDRAQDAPGEIGGDSSRGAGAAAGPDEAGPDPGNPACGADDGRGDYLNCPMTREEYERFFAALLGAELATVHDLDSERFFEGCLPIEVMAHRGADTLRFGPMKPVGLVDPRTGRRPHAVVQLRQDNLAGDHYSLVGFQTQLKWGEQARVLRLIPGLERAEFVRFGMVHRNTYINGPTVLRETWQTRARADLLFAGQVSGVEGYVESAASGLMAGVNAARIALRLPPAAPPRTTAIGALGHYVSHADPAHYEPANVTFGIMAPLDHPPRDRARRKALVAERALADLEGWLQGLGHEAPREAARA